MYHPAQCQKFEEEYKKNGEGSYIVKSACAVPEIGKMWWYPTQYYNQVGHYLDHAQSSNTALTPPIWAKGKWRIGLVAVRDIQKGDDVVRDYMVKREEWSGCRLVKGVVMKGRSAQRRDYTLPGPSGRCESQSKGLLSKKKHQESQERKVSPY